MKEALTLEILGVFCDKNDTARVSSLTVASVFGKDHDKVMRDIKSLDCSDEFNTANFGDIRYTDSRGRKQDAVSMTEHRPQAPAFRHGVVSKRSNLRWNTSCHPIQKAYDRL